MCWSNIIRKCFAHHMSGTRDHSLNGVARFASGSADSKLKFWDFDLVKQSDTGAGQSVQLELTHTRTLTMTDEVLSVCYSNTTKADELLVCVALLDSTVKVFFDDTLKFFLNLYGHKLPVMAMDISSDNNLLVTASADKVRECRVQCCEVPCSQFQLAPPDRHLFRCRTLNCGAWTLEIATSRFSRMLIALWPSNFSPKRTISLVSGRMVWSSIGMETALN